MVSERPPDWRARSWGRARRALAWSRPGPDGIPFMTRGARYSVVALFVLTLLLSGSNLLWTSYQVNAQAHQWCATLDLLTSHPVPRPASPKANPSRAQAYILYSDFRDLRHRLGCG